MSDALAVLLDDELAGRLTRLPGGQLRFEYDAGYQRQAAPTPLSLSMPAQISAHPDRTIAPWLWGLLPDNEAVLRRWARDFQASASSAFSLLATPVGEDCAGAVRFVAPSDVEDALAREGAITWLTEEEVAQRLGDLRQDATAWLGRAFTGQFSLGGAQAKTALVLRDGRWGVPSGAVPTTHILKPAVSGLDDHDLNEHLCLEAARYAGLIAAETTVTSFAGETAVVVRRYDRRALPGGRIGRVHQEDLCQALGVHPSRKYQNDGGPSPLDVVGLLRAALPPRAAEQAVERFVDALIWNWLIAGTDAHAKNYSLLLAGDQVRLAPLYDVASALPYGADEHEMRLAMKLGGRYEAYLRRNPWPRTASDLGLDATAVVDRARALASMAGDAFAQAAAAPHVSDLGRPLSQRLVELVADRARRCLQALASPGSGAAK